MRQLNTHIIKNTSVDFQYTGKTDGMVLQQEVADWCRNVLSPTIDSILTEYDQKEELIFIDNISLDVNIGTTDDWEKVLTEGVIYQLKEKIHSKISSGSADITVKTTTADFSEILIYYLKHGILPWHSIIKTSPEFETEINAWLKSISPEELKHFLLSVRDRRSILRFVNLVKQEDFSTLMTLASCKSTQAILSLFEVVQAIIKSISEEKPMQQRLLNDFKEILVSGFGEKQALDLSKKTISAWIYAIKNNYSFDFQKIDTEKINHAEAKIIFSQIQKVMLSKAESKLTSKSKSKLRNTADEREKIHNEKDKQPLQTPTEYQNPDEQISNAENSILFNPEEIIKALETDTEPDKELSAGVFINNAGAIIIAPFLTALFSRTGLMKEGSITDASTALCLVHYCITGNLNPAEFELLLPKILCGAVPETVVDSTFSADEKMTKEADEMLTSVIEYWKAIKDTSVNGLREAFLQRNGKLTFADDYWLLRVEQKPYDMLLEQLPWNISIIKLPWMTHLLKTEWA